MAHFVEIGQDNVVLRVIVVHNNDCKDENGNESEVVGAQFCRSLLGGTWKQTSYNGNFRKRFAGIGFTYDSSLDAYIAPKPFPSWSLDEETTEWIPPVAYPDYNKLYQWDESLLNWIEQ